MTTDKLSHNILRMATAFLIIDVAIHIVCPHQPKRQNAGELIIRTDTLTIRDTILISKPIIKTVRRIDTIYIPKSQIDTIIRSDTMFVSLPREQRHYEDSRYSAWVSGYNPQLDSLHIYPEHQIITTSITPRKAKPKHFGIGIQAGYGITLNYNQLQTSPYIGIGLSWNIVTF